MPPGDRSRRGIIATAIGALVLLPVLRLDVRSNEVDGTAIVAGATGILLAVELGAVVAGRGRKPPLRRAAPMALIGIAALISWAIWPERVLHIVAAVVIAVTAWIAARYGAGTLLTVAALAVATAQSLATQDADAVEWAIAAAITLVGLAGVRFWRFGSREVAALGFTCWTPGDLALIPSVGFISADILGYTIFRGRWFVYWQHHEAFVALLATGATGTFLLALRYLRRRLDLAEAHAARKIEMNP